MKPIADQPDPFGARESPSDTLIEVREDSGQTLIVIPPRPLTVPLRILLVLNAASVAFLLLVGIIYLYYHISIFSGLPDPIRVFSGHDARIRWYIEFFAGWVVSIVVVIEVLGMVWIPMISREIMALSQAGIHWQRDGWWRHEHIDAAWKELSGIAVVGNMPDIAPNRLIIRLFDGRTQPMAENTSNAERNWIEFVVEAASPRFRGI